MNITGIKVRLWIGIVLGVWDMGLVAKQASEGRIWAVIGTGLLGLFCFGFAYLNAKDLEEIR